MLQSPICSCLSKKITTHADLHDFQNSPAFQQLTTFLQDLVASCRGVSEWNDSCPENLKFFHHLLNNLQKNLQSFTIPEGDQTTSRFGNPLFRSWFTSQALPLIQNATSTFPQEFQEYLILSFGDFSRLDYGTGHELNFLCALYCLSKFLCEFHLPHQSCCVLLLFRQYIFLMHEILKKFLLEPAGSHGVWGLDDFHFLPYLFGASQLTGCLFPRPKSINNQDCIELYSGKNFYFLMISFLQRTKKHSLAWNSPMLYDLTLLSDWRKIALGLEKMYKSEVLGKLPIMQHFWFGREYLRFEPEERDSEEAAKFKVHEFQSCCANIKIPSIYYNEGKELPFD